jgi:hypothetical protein
MALGTLALAGPPAALAADVVGTGSAASCTDAALNTALTGGGLVTFNCGGGLVTIDISPGAGGTGTKNIAIDTTVDGGGVITVSGGNSVGVFSVNTGVKFTVQNITIANGSANDGGGIDNNGTLTVSNSTFSGNSARFGGGIYNSTDLNAGGIVGTLTVTNSTFSSNSADDVPVCCLSNGGGAIANLGPGMATLRNTIVVNSPAGGNCAGIITDGGHNLDDATSCGFATANGSWDNTDPQLDPAGLKDNGGPTQTIALCTAARLPTGCTAASPAINAGDPVVCAAAPVRDFDQRGLPRSSSCDSACDIGAFEFLPKPIDVDANGAVEVSTDIIYVARYILGLTPVPASFRSLDPVIPADADISCRINQLL